MKVIIAQQLRLARHMNTSLNLLQYFPTSEKVLLGAPISTGWLTPTLPPSFHCHPLPHLPLLINVTHSRRYSSQKQRLRPTCVHHHREPRAQTVASYIASGNLSGEVNWRALRRVKTDDKTSRLAILPLGP